MARKIIVVLSILLLFVGGYVLMNLSYDKDQDLIRYKSRIYSNVTDLEWFEEKKDAHQKGEKFGEIERKTSSRIRFLLDFSATALPKGTPLYHTADGEYGIILVEKENGELLYYFMQLKE